MRKITLPMVPVTIRVEQDDRSFKTESRTPGWLLAQVLSSPNLTFAQISKRLPIHDKLVNGKTTILLEEDQWRALLTRRPGSRSIGTPTPSIKPRSTPRRLRWRRRRTAPTARRSEGRRSE